MHYDFVITWWYEERIMRNKGVIALGSNVAPKRNIPEAVKRIKDEVYVLRESAFVFTKPLGYADQPDFLNGAVLIQTDRKSTRLNSSHVSSSYAVFYLKKKKDSQSDRYTHDLD